LPDLARRRFRTIINNKTFNLAMLDPPITVDELRKIE